MKDEKDWFEVIKHKDYLHVIRERLDDVDPRYFTIYSNFYLIIGSHSALLIDTGCGIVPLKPIIKELIGERRLLVINTHSHWDHVCGNAEFEEIYIHESELSLVSNPINLSMLKDSPKKVIKYFEKDNFLVSPAKNVIPIKDGKIFDLGDINLEIIHTPGHSPGCISILTSRKELFVGDMAVYGSVYLPKKRRINMFISSLSKLIERLKDEKEVEIYPSHESFPASIELLQELKEGLQDIDNSWSDKERDDFLHSWIINYKKFKFIISKI